VVFDPIILKLVIVELFNGFQNNLDVRFSESIDELGTVFVSVNHQVEIVCDFYEILCPNTILIRIELRFQNVETC
jgi:hypothetical protein